MIQQLRLVAWIEGISYLVLLFIAMPIKYINDDPSWVRVTGMIHGVLFVLFTVMVVRARSQYEWSSREALRVFATSLVPFGMVIFDRMIERLSTGA